MGLRETTATWEMLVKFKEAILSVSWPGQYVHAVAMGLEMTRQMEVQYRVQLEAARKEAEAQKQSAKEVIANAGGAVQ